MSTSDNCDEWIAIREDAFSVRDPSPPHRERDYCDSSTINSTSSSLCSSSTSAPATRLLLHPHHHHRNNNNTNPCSSSTTSSTPTSSSGGGGGGGGSSSEGGKPALCFRVVRVPGDTDQEPRFRVSCRSLPPGENEATTAGTASSSSSVYPDQSAAITTSSKRDHSGVKTASKQARRTTPIGKLFDIAANSSTCPIGKLFDVANNPSPSSSTTTLPSTSSHIKWDHTCVFTCPELRGVHRQLSLVNGLVERRGLPKLSQDERRAPRGLWAYLTLSSGSHDSTDTTSTPDSTSTTTAADSSSSCDGQMPLDLQPRVDQRQQSPVIPKDDQCGVADKLCYDLTAYLEVIIFY